MTDLFKLAVFIRAHGFEPIVGTGSVAFTSYAWWPETGYNVLEIANVRSFAEARAALGY